MKTMCSVFAMGLAAVVLSACGASNDQSSLNDNKQKNKKQTSVKEETVVTSAVVSQGDVSLGKPIFHLAAQVYVASSKCARSKVESTKFVQSYEDGVLKIAVEQTIKQTPARPCADDHVPVFEDMNLDVSVDLQQGYKVVLKNYQQMGKDFVIMEPTKAKLVSQEIWRDNFPTIEARMKAQVAPYKNECEEKSVNHASLVYITSQKPTEAGPTATAFAILIHTPVIDGNDCNAKKKPAANAPVVFRAIDFTSDEFGKILFKADFLGSEQVMVYPAPKKKS